MAIRGIRGATTVEENKAEAILSATRELLELIVEANALRVEDIASALFTTTRDLDAAYPAAAARALGWTHAALMCMHEMDVPRGLPRCIRVLIHWNTNARQDEVKHVYMRGATVLRPDLLVDERSTT
jgi:chorismate mutase